MNPLTLNNHSLKHHLLNGRRDLLWNVSEPGDPYDIRKSMIAKMPGDKKIFMGEHLELVCLLQAAQIQRLCQFLDDYKLRFRQIERSNLDRHSYQIQIKELTQRLAQQQSSKSQNSKLVDFIKRLQQEIQILRSTHRDTSSSSQGLRLTYERSLELTNQLSLQNRQLKERMEELRLQFLSLTGRYQALEKAKNKQLQEVKLQYSQNSRQSYESSINSVRFQVESDLRKLEYQAKRLKQLNQAKNAQISDLQRQREELMGKLKLAISESNSDLNRQIYEYQNKFVLFGQQIERLNIALRDYLNKLDESQNRNKELIKINQRIDFQKKQIQVRLRTSMGEVTRLNDLIKRYQTELSKVDTQQIFFKYEEIIGELTSKFKYQTQLTRTLKDEIERLTFENSKVRLFEKENSELRLQVNEINIYKTKLVQTENRIALLSQQLQRLRMILQQKEAQYNRSILSENEVLKSKIRETQASLSYKYESQITRMKVEYDQRLQMITKATGSEIQTKSKFYESEFQKVREQLRVRNEDFERQKTRIYELQTQISRNEVQSTAKVRNYEFNISNLKRDLQQILSKNKILGEVERRNFELQSKITLIERELDYVNQNSKIKDQEMLNLKSRAKENEYSFQQFEADVAKKVNIYEQTISTLRSDNEEIKRKLNDFYNQSNKKLLQASNEIERLGNSIRQLSQENEYLKQNIQRISLERDELLRRTQELEFKLNATQNETSVQLRSATQENQNLKRQLSEYKSTINRYQAELSKLSGNMEQTLTTLSRQNDNLKSKISTYQSKLTLLSQEFERLNLLLRNKNEQFAQLDLKYKTQINEYEKLRRQFSQFETFRNRFEQEVTLKFNNYEQALQQSRKETEELRKRYAQLERNYFAEKESWRVKLSQQENGTVEYNKKITVYQNNVLNLTRINEELQRKLTEIEGIQRQKTEDCNRFQNNLKNAGIEFQNLKRQFKQIEGTLIQKYEAELKRRQALFEQKYSQIALQNQQLRRRNQQMGGDSSRRISEYDFKLKQALQENENLKRKVDSYETSITNYESQVKKRFAAYEQNINNQGRQNDEYRRKLQEMSQLSRKMAEYQNKIAILSQEIERLQSMLKNLSLQNENLKRQLYQKQSERNHYEQEVSKVVAVYEQNTLSVSEDYKRKISEYEQRLIALSKQLERVNTAIRIKTQQNSKLDQTVKSVSNESEFNKKKVYELQTLISTKYELEFSRKLTNYEQSVAQLTHQNEELNRRLREGADWSRKYSELQNRIAITNQQLQRLTQGLKSKQEELNKLDQICRNQSLELQSERRKFTELEAKFTRSYQLQVSKINRGYEQSVQTLRSGIAQYQNKLHGTTQEIQRLNNVLRLKVEESIQLNNRLSSLNAELQDSKRRLREMESAANQNIVVLRKQNEQLARQLHDLDFNIRQNQQSNQHKFTSYQSKCKVQAQEIERLGQLLKSRGEEIDKERRQFKQYQDSLTIQIKGNYGQYQARINEFRRENEELKRINSDMKAKIIDYENKLVLASQEMERLSTLIKSKSEELQSLGRENQSLRQRLQDFNEFSRKVSQYEFKIGQIIQQNQKLQTALRGKAEDLANVDIKNRQQQLQSQGLKKQLREYEFEFGRKVSSYEQTSTQLKRDNQDLSRKRTQFQSKIAIITQQLERVNNQLRIKSEESLRISQQFEAYRRSRQTDFEGEYAVLKQNYTLICGEYETAKKHLLQYEQSLVKLSAQFQRLHGIINHVNGQKQSLIEKNRILSEEIKRLNLENKDLDQQARDIRLRLTDETALQKRINEHLGLMVLLFAEIETLRNRVKAKQQQVVEVRKSSLAPHIV